MLEDEGWTRRSIGCSDSRPSPRGYCASAEVFPRTSSFRGRAITEAFLEVIRAPSCPALQYGWPEGDADLRAWIAARLRARGANVHSEDVIVTNGAQQALSIAADILLPPGARVAVDRETYPAALDLFRTRGADPVLSLDGAACAYAMPGVANPRGDALTSSRRGALLRSRLPIIADEAYAELRFDGVVDAPLLPDARGSVWHVGTFSKTLCPGFRVGWLVPPPSELKSALRVKHDRDLQAGSLAQQVLRAFLDADDFDARSLARASSTRRARSDSCSGRSETYPLGRSEIDPPSGSLASTPWAPASASAARSAPGQAHRSHRPRTRACASGSSFPW